MSYIQECKQQTILLKQELCRLLNWNQLQYGEFQYRQGCQYLQQYIPGDPAGIDVLVQSTLYWNWWKNQWCQRDHTYLVSVALHLPNLSIEDLRAIYGHHHDVRILAREISPNSIVLGAGYKKNTCKVIKAEVA